MISFKKAYLILLIAVFLLSGCSASTSDRLFSPPKHAAGYENIQLAINRAMDGREYTAPLAGVNRQTVQCADLNGDGQDEYLVFCRSGDTDPMRILVFRRDGDAILCSEICGAGTEFDRVAFVQIDGKPGYELLVGYQVDSRFLRSLCIYSFADGSPELLMRSTYRQMLTADLSGNGQEEVLIMGSTGGESSTAELYGWDGENMVQQGQAALSGKADDISRISNGILQDGKPAVYITCTLEENISTTDVLMVADGMLNGISFLPSVENSVRNTGSYFVYASDIDGDGVTEIPELVSMVPLQGHSIEEQQFLIRWYAVYANGNRRIKGYTYHNFAHGWFLRLNKEWTDHISVTQRQQWYDFYVWDEDYNSADIAFSIAAFSGSDREELSTENNRFVLFKGDNITYSAELKATSALYGISQENLIDRFHLILQD